MKLPYDKLLSDDCLIITLLIAIFGAVTTSQWFWFRLYHGSAEGLPVWSAVWPGIMIFVYAWTVTHLRTARHPSLVVALAFGFGFSVALIRFPRWPSRILGVAFVLVFAYLTLEWWASISVIIT